MSAWATYPKLSFQLRKLAEIEALQYSGQTCATIQCSAVRMVWLIYNRESHSGRLVRKSMKFWWFLKGNIVTSIAGNTFSGQGMLFGTFLMKNIFIDFPTPILKHIFCYIWLKISCFLQANLIVMWEYIMRVQIKPMKSIGFFDEIMQKICFKIGVGKSMKIFFIRNVPNNIPWPLKVLPVMPVTMFPFKNHKKHVFHVCAPL